MGMSTEFNWYLVVDSEEGIVKGLEGDFKTWKSGNRIYPIDGIIPLIIKNKGCVAMVKIKRTINTGENTIIKFVTDEKLSLGSEISQHYYEMYLRMKSEGGKKPEIKSFKNSVMNRENEDEEA